jgi:hypothetical protein
MLGAGTPAQATITLAGCTITPLTPTPVFLSSTGEKVADGRASVRCTRERGVSLEIALYGEDLVFDDNQGWNYHGVRAGPEPKTMGGFNTNTMKPSGHLCNEDPEGPDELYTRVRGRLVVSYNTFGRWSAWERGPTVTYSC